MVTHAVEAMVQNGQACRCRCGCLLARVSVPVAVRFDTRERGVEIRCRRCKTHAVLIPATAAVNDHIADKPGGAG